jgi:hypothetical protein
MWEKTKEFCTTKLKFITLHYIWIIFCASLSLVILYPYGNLAAVDAFFFGASASTESGLNTIDVKNLKTYQQVYIYIIPVITNLGFVNIAVVLVRLWWFRQRLATAEPASLRRDDEDVEGKPHDEQNDESPASKDTFIPAARPTRSMAIKFDEDLRDSPRERPEFALRVPGPRDRENGICIHI